MFRNKGNSRTYVHNLKLASTLSFVAGLVNVAGFLAVRQLTTNVTGHFAFFVGEMYHFDWYAGLTYFLFIFSFFFGSFCSGTMVELATRVNPRFRYILPLSLEIIILTVIGVLGADLIEGYANLIAYCLLFAMGLQNSLVTTISNSIVRTTHLTGLFTDLGIELSQMFFYRSREDRAKLARSMKLRFAIIGFFFLGGVVSGVTYSRIGLRILLFGVALLIVGLIFDSVKVRARLIRRRIQRR